MPCQAITAYVKQCGKGISGGVDKLYVIGLDAFNAPIAGTTDLFTTASGTSIVNKVAVSGTTKFVSVGILKESVSFKGSAKRDSSTGSFENQTETSITISNISEAAKVFVDNLFMQPVVLLMKLRSGIWVVTGLNGFTELTGVEESTGTKNGDANGYQITLSGVEDGLTRTIDATYAATIV